jgi:hypothetical protein
MATVNSDQVAGIGGVSATPRKVYERDWLGTSRKQSFTYTVPAGNQAIGDILRAVKVPKGSFIVDFWFGFEAMTTGAGAASADVGLTADGQRYLTGLSIDAAGEKRAAFVLDKMPDRAVIADDDTFFIFTVATEAWAATKKIQGWIEVVP